MFNFVRTRLSDLKPWLPVLAFFAGFLWDALTIGKAVVPLDLWLLAGYLAGAAGILWWLGHRRHREMRAEENPPPELAPAIGSPPSSLSPWLERAPYLLLQFLFGGLFSALFILYFQSSSHLSALFWSLGLGGLLVANEFLDNKYNRFTLTWLLFGLCAMLLFNFILPFMAGSIGIIWFYLSTGAGAGFTHWLRQKTPGCPGRIVPVWVLAGLLALAWPLDLIPPVPLVKRSIQVGKNLVHEGSEFRLTMEKAPWWVFWRELSNEVHLGQGEKLYCVSAVFAPRGLRTRLNHRWQHYEPGRGWQTAGLSSFSLSGGRSGGFRGYTFRKGLSEGAWRVAVETEDGRTVVIHNFRVVAGPVSDPERNTVRSL